MVDIQHTNEQLDRFVEYVKNVRAEIKDGKVSDTTDEMGAFFRKYVDIHKKAERARIQLQELKARYDTKIPPSHQDYDAIWFLLSDAARFLDGAEDGSFRTLLFQSEHRQARAFAEIERRVDCLCSVTQRIAEVWDEDAEL